MEKMKFSKYARILDRRTDIIGRSIWHDNEELLIYLRLTQNWMNDRLKINKFLTLNDVYKELGIKEILNGDKVGWIYDEKHPVGDNYVDFGIYNIEVDINRDFMRGLSTKIVLDFNVDEEL